MNEDFSYLADYARSSAQQAEFCLVLERTDYRDHEVALTDILAHTQCDVLFAKGFEQKTIGELHALVTMAHAHEIAILIVDNVDLALEARANGAHLTSLGETVCTTSSLGQWRKQLDKDFILGGMIEANRHDAMVMGEAGADYLGLGSMDQPINEGSLEPLTTLTKWLYDISKLSITIFGAQSPSHIEQFIKAGASHIAVSLKLWTQIHAKAPQIAAINS